MSRGLFTLLLALPWSGAAAADDLAVHPAGVMLTGSRATQQLLVVTESGGRAVADRTADARFRSADPKVATVDESGVVHPVGDGETVVTATVDGRSAASRVRVSAAGKASPPSFRHHVEPILTRTGCNSGACHGALAGKGGFKLSLRGYDPDADHFALTRQAQARRVDGQKPEESLFLRKATRAMTHGGGTRFDAESDHYKLLRDWVSAGAPGVNDADPTLARIEVYPKAALLKPKDMLRVLVRAVYSDGTVADVSRLAKYLSSEEQVATVDEEGTITIAGSGEAGVAVLFGTRVATLTVTSPYPNTVADATFARARAANFIDELVLKKLQLLLLEPSPDCTDPEFVRRVYLDTCGILPTPEEVTAFHADKSADRRAELIDKLLDRPEYVDYWAHKWSDLLLVSSRKLPAPAMWAFYRTVRRGVAKASYPAGTRAMQLPDSLLVSPFLDAFGRAVREQTCSCEKSVDANIGQALHLNNGKTLNDKLRDPKSRLSQWLTDKAPDAVIVDHVFRFGLSRPPTDEEKQRFLAVLAEASREGSQGRREALEDVFWAVLAGKEFLFNH